MKVLSNFEVEILRNLPEVTTAQRFLSQQSTAYFYAEIPESIKETLHEKLGINLSGVSRVPLRWIRGDTKEHVDRGARAFDNTYLVYLTDGEGQFHIGDETYPIEAGNGFVFSEGTPHSVVNTNDTSRLLLGPMSETGMAVGGGGVSADGATTTIYIRQDPDTLDFEYRYNNGDWTSFLFAASSVQNTNPNPSTNILKVIFTTNLVLDSVEHYFVCASNGIQFGSDTLNEYGQKRSIVVDGVALYGGLFQNGTSGTSGYSNISIYNLSVSADNGATLTTGGGWIARPYFGRVATENYIINCSSDADIASFGGGIVGIYAAYTEEETSTSLYVIGCQSSGAIDTSAGGIVGARCGSGSGGSCTIEQCWSTGTISDNAGGIVGQYAAQIYGSLNVSKCYSTGNSTGGSFYGGGICGSFAGFDSGAVAVEKSYSTGTIMELGGGIYGGYAGFASGTTTASKCYSSGTITTSETGIFGSNKETGTASNCYSANGSWSDSTANTTLQGVPDSIPGAGTTWASTGTNTPYELVDFGVTPYQLQSIDANELVQSYSQSVERGGETIETIFADASGNEFVILKKTGGDASTITISQQTGKISTTSETPPGTYTLAIRSAGSYSITTFLLTVIATSTTIRPFPVRGKGYDFELYNKTRVGEILVRERLEKPNIRFTSFAEYNKYRMALLKLQQ